MHLNIYINHININVIFYIRPYEIGKDTNCQPLFQRRSRGDGRNVGFSVPDDDMESVLAADLEFQKRVIYMMHNFSPYFHLSLEYSTPHTRSYVRRCLIG